MLVVCINASGDVNLTKDKIYSVVEVYEITSGWRLIDDAGYVGVFEKARFKVVDSVKDNLSIKMEERLEVTKNRGFKDGVIRLTVEEMSLISYVLKK